MADIGYVHYQRLNFDRDSGILTPSSLLYEETTNYGITLPDYELMYGDITYSETVTEFDNISSDFWNWQPPYLLYTEADIPVFLNGNKLEFDQAPILYSDRRLIPMRAIFEALGANVVWDDSTKSVTSEKDRTEVTLTIDKNEMYKNGQMIWLDVPAKLINGRTMVPVRAVAEAFGCSVEWDSETKTITITS